MANQEHAKYGEKPPVEIERKFLVTKVPEEVDAYPATRIVQGYLAIEPEGTEVRVRGSDSREYTLTIKSKGGLVRGERETMISEEQFGVLWPATEGRRVQKTRYAVPYGAHTIELDIYEGALDGLAVAEVEFDNLEQAASFEPPEWFGWDVTDNASFKNQQLAVNGAPD